MKRMLVLGTLAGAGALTLTIHAYQAPPQPPAAKVVEAQKLKDNLYMLTGAGGGGNTAILITTNGVVVVDTKNPGWGQPIINKIKELTPKPITTIINTHTHGDHVSGNVEFPAAVDVVVQENTAANMKRMAPVTGLAPAGAAPAPNIFEQNGGKGLAKRTFKDRMTIGSGNDRIELYYFGRGHTNGDAWVVFPALRTVHAGDIFSGKNLPLLDANNGGTGVEIGTSLGKAADGIKDVDAIITGHSTVMTPADLREYAQFNNDFLADVRAGLNAGKSVDEIAAGWKINDKYKNYTIAEPRLKTNVQVIANELKK
jgi:glyoxylase-like metal-dependent hydrolase (beta-lactamase superfamily II)